MHIDCAVLLARVETVVGVMRGFDGRVMVRVIGRSVIGDGRLKMFVNRFLLQYGGR